MVGQGLDNVRCWALIEILNVRAEGIIVASIVHGDILQEYSTKLMENLQGQNYPAMV